MASMYPPPRRRPLRRRPIRHGILLGLVMVVAEAFAAYAPVELGRAVANDVVRPVLASAWVLALFAVWLGRGARSGLSAAVMGAIGLLAASVIRLVGDFGLTLMRGASPQNALERLLPNVSAWVAGPVLVGVVAGVIGWLTTLLPGWLNERRYAGGPAAADGAPETPIRHYGLAGRGSTAHPPAPTRPIPSHGGDDPTERIPTAPRTPSDPEPHADSPTRRNPLRRW